jgi:glycosyltransferase involved in cell wall biosynthesis
MIEKYRAITAVALPGRVSDDEMRALYEAAICVVTPSRAEGFSLPVIEAAAAGTPAIVSDIPAHRALIPDDTCRFAPDEEAALARILESLVQTPVRRDAIIGAQAGLAAAFTPAAIAAKIWGALLQPSPAIARRAKPRIALISPLPPDKSGVADYSMALAAALRGRAAVTLFPGPHTSPLPYLSGKFDRVVAAIGNGPLHADIHALSTQHGAAVICHDHRLLGLATSQGLAASRSWASQELGREVNEAEIAAWAADENRRAASFLGPLARTARPLIFHAQAPVELVRQRFGAEARHLPFAIYRPFAGAITPHRRAAARAALGYRPGQKIIASFGFITPHKGLAVLLRAFARLPETARLVLVGEISAEASALASRASELGITARVTLGAGYMPEAQYRAHLLAADVAIQLREGGPGNISGALQDCIAAGLPSVANADLAQNLNAPSYVTRISDALDEAEIAAALAAAGPQDTETARRAYCAACSMDRYAEQLLRVLEL